MSREHVGRGRPRSPEANRAILMQTLRLLAEQGYTAMSVEGVAAAAGVSKATIYRRYRDKRELVAAALSLLRQEAPALTDTGDVQQDLLNAITDTLRYFRNLNGFAIIGTLLTQARQNPEFLGLFREHVILPRRAAIKELLERRIQRGQLRDDLDLEATVDCIAGPVFARYLSGLPMDEHWLQWVVRIVLEGARSVPGE